MFKALEIDGLRGFSNTQTLKLAVPTNEPGSGLTVIVGANNSGKSTVVEAFRAFSTRNSISFTEGSRNRVAGDRVNLCLVGINNERNTINSIRAGSSEVNKIVPTHGATDRIYVLNSRRSFNPFFGKNELSREQFLQSQSRPANRSDSLSYFEGRLFKINRDNDAFNGVLKRIVDPVPQWSIDQHDTGNYYLKCTSADGFHNSEGLGEGLISLLYIVDALYDSVHGDVIVIDEPELSLHPAILRRLATVLAEFSADRQIVLATHSPYFCELENFVRGAEFARTHKSCGASTIASLSDDLRSQMRGLLADKNNPHTFGLNAREAFFLDENVVLVEGQEDVVFLPVVEASIGMRLRGSVMGFGVGGADKMKVFCQLLKELGYERVVGILDRNKADLVPVLAAAYEQYFFAAIPADDIRTKAARHDRPAITGLLSDDNSGVRDEYLAGVRLIFDRINAYFVEAQPGQVTSATTANNG